MCSNDVSLARLGTRRMVSYLEGEVEISNVPTALRNNHDEGIGVDGGFDDYLHSYASSPFEETSSVLLKDIIPH
ncbi:L-type lectin-domain containing receptor kinase -like [Olea europaea subsp. europaea]|uniref:L-type lectin-domain containing receptor kinase -like n=1 Tax=Olea europaea subsp. europaea TaxID=158383 RepID=A0A8S0PLV5_OLEEU|nr:L-type lectin-domain containing receptor kinase -like [Olea europaea subsp. europaea]